MPAFCISPDCCKPVLTVAYSVLPQVMHRSVPFRPVNPINLSESQIFSRDRVFHPLRHGIVTVKVALWFDRANRKDQELKKYSSFFCCNGQIYFGRLFAAYFGA
jgi:hypothetical protein